MIISLDEEQTLIKSKAFMIKVLERLWILGTYLDITKAVYSKLIVNITLNEEKLKGIPLKPGTSYSCQPLPYLFYYLKF